MIFPKALLISAAVILTGCSASVNSRDIYKKSVRQEVRQAAGQFQGGNFPFYHWSAPIVQEVLIPAHLTNGVMIPQHTELVIIKPGEWIMDHGYPIQSQTQRNHYEHTAAAVRNGTDLTALPASMGFADQPGGKR